MPNEVPPRIFNRMTHYESVRAQAEKIKKLHEYGVTIDNLAVRYATSTNTIKEILREAK